MGDVWNKNNIYSLLTIHFSSKNKNIQMDDKIQPAKIDLKVLVQGSYTLILSSVLNFSFFPDHLLVQTNTVSLGFGHRFFFCCLFQAEFF